MWKGRERGGGGGVESESYDDNEMRRKSMSGSSWCQVPYLATLALKGIVFMFMTDQTTGYNIFLHL
jgi:hypothetical protein